METQNAVTALAALAQECRLEVFRLLVEAGPAGLAAGQISERLGVPPSSLSFHLKELNRAGLVSSRQQSRFVIYSANFDAMNDLIEFLTENCCGGESCAPDAASGGGGKQSPRIGTAKTYNVLFVCTGNSARSIMAEAILNHLGQGRIHAYSAGSMPAGKVHPMALAVLRDAGLPTGGLRSKSWNEFLEPGAPRMDFVFSLCGRIAGEPCPTWPGAPITGHWNFDDPATASGAAEQRRRVFERTHQEISQRVRLFLSLPLAKLDRLAAKQRVGELDSLHHEV